MSAGTNGVPLVTEGETEVAAMVLALLPQASWPQPPP